MASSASQRITLTNSGNAPLTITGITATGDFSDVTDYTVPLAAAGVCHIDVTFTPTAPGARTGTISIASNASGSPNVVTLNGTGVAGIMPRLSISGNQFVTPTGTKVRLKSVSWFGAESTNYIPHGCWTRRWSDMLVQMQGMGFNCIRLPFSGDMCSPGRTPPSTAFVSSLNPDFVGQTSLQILDLIVNWCQTNNMYIVFDHHRCSAGDGTDSGIVAPYSEAQWHADWVLLATRYAANTCVVGADLHNEPYEYTWAAWSALVVPCAEAILVAAPAWLIFVEGVGSFSGVCNGVTYTDDYTWWGGQLMGVQLNPIVLSVPNKVVYSPHEYGVSVGSQPWLSTDSTPVTGFPGTINTEIHNHWGYIYESGFAPIWIGEMGGKFGVDGTGTVGGAPNGTSETAWMNRVIAIIDGDFAGTGVTQDTAGNKGMSFAYWGYPPVSEDTGGLIEDDWISPQTVKLAILAPLMAFAGS